MVFAFLGLLFAAFDFGPAFSEPEAWDETAVDFTVDHAKNGFKFASAKRDAVVNMHKGESMWNGLPVWEARILYSKPNEGPSRIELSLYNRGDDRLDEGLSEAEFNKDMLPRIKKILSAKSKPSTPTKKELRTGGFSHSIRWEKATPAAELTWGTTGGKARGREVEFVRLSLSRAKSAASAAKRGAGPLSGVAAKAKVKKNVQKNDAGDVWIANVPMVDQGQKGYCAAAVAERILRYYGHNIDEHEIAQMAGTTAERGTSVDEMIATVKTVGSKCRLGFNSIVSMGGNVRGLEKEIDQYNRAAKAMKEREISLAEFTHGNTIFVSEMRGAMKPKVLKRMRTKDANYKKFLAGVKTQIDQGIPVIWGVTLGIFPEPGVLQSIGGHMRIIIGYNDKTDELLYTDTWGAGHELKRMPKDWAFTITHDAFFLRPL